MTVEIRCQIAGAEDRSQKHELANGESVTTLHRAGFALETDGAPPAEWSIPKLLTLVGRRVRIIVEDEPPKAIWGTRELEVQSVVVPSLRPNVAPVEPGDPSSGILGPSPIRPVLDAVVDATARKACNVWLAGGPLDGKTWTTVEGISAIDISVKKRTCRYEYYGRSYIFDRAVFPLFEYVEPSEKRAAGPKPEPTPDDPFVPADGPGLWIRGYHSVPPEHYSFTTNRKLFGAELDQTEPAADEPPRNVPAAASLDSWLRRPKLC